MLCFINDRRPSPAQRVAQVPRGSASGRVRTDLSVSVVLIMIQFVGLRGGGSGSCGRIFLPLLGDPFREGR